MIQGSEIKKELVLVSNTGVDLPPENELRKKLETSKDDMISLLDEPPSQI